MLREEVAIETITRETIMIEIIMIEITMIEIAMIEIGEVAEIEDREMGGIIDMKVETLKEIRRGGEIGLLKKEDKKIINKINIQEIDFELKLTT